MSQKLPLIARTILGLAFVVFGLNGFFQFIPPQPPPTGAAANFLGGLFAAGYMFPLIKGTEVLAGALLLTGTLVPFALVILAPVVVNIVAFHAFLSPGLGLPLFLTALGLYVAWSERQAFHPLFQSRRAVERESKATAAGGHAHA